MQRRVRQGYPERFSTVISTLDARGFAWTDGVVGDPQLFAFEHPVPGVVVEFQVGRWFGETGSGGPPPPSNRGRTPHARPMARCTRGWLTRH